MNKEPGFESANQPKKVISTLPDWIKPENVVARKIINIEGIEYEYLVIDNDFATKKGAPELFAFVDVVKNNFGIGSHYPEKYADLAVRHEITERILNPGRREEIGICLECLKKELDMVKQDPNIDYVDYVNTRFKFFQGMVELYEKSGDKRTDLDNITLEQIKLSRDHLRQVQDGLLLEK